MRVFAFYNFLAGGKGRGGGWGRAAEGLILGIIIIIIVIISQQR